MFTRQAFINTLKRILEGVVIGFSAGLILILSQWGYRTWDYEATRSDQLYEVQQIMYLATDAPNDTELMNGVDRHLGTSYVLLTSKLMAKLLQYESSHLTSAEKALLAWYVSTIESIRVDDPEVEAMFAQTIACTLLNDFELHEPLECQQHAFESLLDMFRHLDASEL